MMKSLAVILLLISTGQCKILQDCGKEESIYGFNLTIFLKIVCGVPNIFHGRIVNGQETSPHKYPWMAAMISPNGFQVCGGAIIG